MSLLGSGDLRSNRERDPAPECLSKTFGQCLEEGGGEVGGSRSGAPPGSRSSRKKRGQFTSLRRTAAEKRSTRSTTMMVAPTNVATFG